MPSNTARTSGSRSLSPRSRAHNQVIKFSSFGHRLIPTAYSSLVEGVAEHKSIAHFRKILKFIAREGAETPSLQTYIMMQEGLKP